MYVKHAELHETKLTPQGNYCISQRGIFSYLKSRTWMAAYFPEIAKLPATSLLLDLNQIPLLCIKGAVYRYNGT